MSDIVEQLTRNWTSFIPCALLALAGLAWFVRKSIAQGRISLSDYKVDPAYREARETILRYKPEGIVKAGDLYDPSKGPRAAYGVVMDVGYAAQVLTLSAFRWGDARMLTSDGLGVRLDLPSEAVLDAARGFVDVAETRGGTMMETTAFPLPRPGRVKFYVLAYGGVLTTDVRLSPVEPQVAALARAGQDLIQAIEDAAKVQADNAGLTTPVASA